MTFFCSRDPDTFEVWMEVLKRVKDSVLWLLRHPSALGEHYLREEARRCGVDDSKQLLFTDSASKEEHFHRHHLVDLILEPDGWGFLRHLPLRRRLQMPRYLLHAFSFRPRIDDAAAEEIATYYLQRWKERGAIRPVPAADIIDSYVVEASVRERM